METIDAKIIHDQQGIGLDINGHLFSADLKYSLLIDRSDPLNSICFHDMHDKGTHYEFSYDPVENCITAPWEPEGLTVKVPQQIAIDPQAVAEKYGITQEQLPKRDSELIPNENWLQSRLQGNLPQIEIAGKDYFVDLRLNELRAATDPDDRIDLSKLVTAYDGRYICFYNTENGKVVTVGSDITRTPENVKMLLLPSPICLDPVSVARTYNMDERAFQDQFPVLAKHQARSYGLAQTGIPALAEENRAKASVKIKDQQKSERPKRKRGHRL